ISPLRGVYDVEALAYSPGIAPRLFPAGEQWTRIAIENSGFVTVWTTAGRQRDMLTSLDSTSHQLALVAAPDSAVLGLASGYAYATDVAEALRAVPPDSNARVTLTGALGGSHLTLTARRSSDSVVLRLTRWPDSRITLLRCPTHLVNDRPYSGV